MTKKFDHPYFCKDIPRFPTKLEAHEFIETYKDSGHIKKCTHLTIHDHSATGTYFGSNEYSPYCEKDYFEIKLEPRRYATDRPRKLFFGCPSNCPAYEYYLKRKVLKNISDWYQDNRRDFIGVAHWFSKLGPIVQTAIVIAILVFLSVAVGLTHADRVIEILKALHGK